MPYRETQEAACAGSASHVGAMCPIAPNALWALDFQFDTTVDGRTLKLLNVVDEFTRECPAIVVDRSIDADHVVATLDRLALERGAPAFVRFDNGPEFIAHAVADWCRFNGVGYRLHRPRLTMAERLDRIVQRPAPRRAAQRLALRHPARSPGDHRGLAHRLQHQPTPLARTATSPRASSPKRGPPNTNQHSHNRWTTHRGPLRGVKRGIQVTPIPHAHARQHHRHRLVPATVSGLHRTMSS